MAWVIRFVEIVSPVSFHFRELYASHGINIRFFSFSFFFFSLYFLRSRFVPFRVYYFSRLLEIIKKYISLPRHPGLVVFLSAVMTSRDQGHAPCSQTVAVRPIRVNKPGSSIQSPLIRNPFSFFLESQDPIRKFN